MKKSFKTYKSLEHYARIKKIHYLTAWRHLKKGYVRGKKSKSGNYSLIVEMRQARKGRPQEWSRAEVVRAVNRLCRDRYMKASDFPFSLYKLCRKYCGSVRAAKWE